VHSHIHTESHHDTQHGGHDEHAIAFICQASKTEHLDVCRSHTPTPFIFSLHKNKSADTAQWVASIYFENLSLRAPPVMV